ncbi:MAG: FecR domain-containing protein [Spirochaetia bacterium]|nr:FecR domain-containing protein [Spirochaetia bacterium]
MSQKEHSARISALYLVLTAVLCLTPAACALHSEPSPESGTTEIIVKKGDTLAIIAKEHLDDPSRWRELLKYNQISDPNMIKPGLKLVVPAKLAKKPMALVQMWRGTVEYQKKGEPAWKIVQPMLGLFAEDTVRTGKKSAVKLKVRDGVEISIEENTLFVIGDRAAGTGAGFHGFLKSGTARTAIDTKKTGPFRMDVTTPTAVASVRGTEFLTSVDASETTLTACYQGVVQVTAQGKSVSLSAGYGTTVKKGQAPSEPYKLPDAPSLDDSVEVK